MELSITIAQVYESYPILEALGRQRLWAPVAHRIGHNALEVGREFRQAQEAMVALIEKYGGNQETPGIWTLKPESNTSAYREEVAALLAETVEVRIRLVTLADLQRVEISGEEIVKLDWMIRDEDGDEDNA